MATNVHVNDAQSPGAKRRLRRDVGLLGLTFAVVGSIIGSGWLLGALSAAQVAGPASIISWILAAFIIALLALVHAELSAAYPVAGGSARFPYYAFGGMAGFTAGWMGWLFSVTLAPIEVEAALQYATNYLPGLSQMSGNQAVLTPLGYLVAGILMLVFTGINAWSVKFLAWTNTTAVWWKIAIPVLTMEQSVSFVEAGVTGARALNSQRRYNKAYENFKQMSLLWSQEKRVKTLGELFYK